MGEHKEKWVITSGRKWMVWRKEKIKIWNEQ